MSLVSQGVILSVSWDEVTDMTHWTLMLTALGVFVPAMAGAFVSIRKELLTNREAVVAVQEKVQEVHTIVNSQRTEMTYKIAQLESLLSHATGELKELRAVWHSERVLNVEQPSPSVEMRADSIVPGAGTQKE